MKYSVWNQGASAYDYYEDGRTQDTLNVEKPSHMRSRTLGSTVDQSAWPLPADAVKVGQGAAAIGRVAGRSSGLAGIGDDPSLVKIGLLAGCALLLWKYAVKPGRRS